VLGPFKGSVDAISPGLSYTSVIGKTPFIFNLRHCTEFNATMGGQLNNSIGHDPLLIVRYRRAGKCIPFSGGVLKNAVRRALAPIRLPLFFC
jgi:hypothetical protein